MTNIPKPTRLQRKILLNHFADTALDRMSQRPVETQYQRHYLKDKEKKLFINWVFSKHVDLQLWGPVSKPWYPGAHYDGLLIRFHTPPTHWVSALITMLEGTEKYKGHCFSYSHIFKDHEVMERF